MERVKLVGKILCNLGIAAVAKTYTKTFHPKRRRRFRRQVRYLRSVITWQPVQTPERRSPPEKRRRGLLYTPVDGEAILQSHRNFHKFSSKHS
nr:PIPO [Plum pox virus]